MSDDVEKISPLATARAAFPNTVWSAVVAAMDEDPERATRALARLCENYREPIANWFRRAGLQAADADDQAQQFLTRHFAGSRLKNYERRQARFRSWLLVCLRRQVMDWRRREGAGPDLEPLDDTELAQGTDTEAAALDRDVALTVHQRALSSVRAGWPPDRLDLFGVLTSFLFADPELGAYARTAEQYQLPTRQVKAEVFKLRNDYSVAFHGEVRQICLPGDDEAEMKHLLSLAPRD